jgi:hypothetical protein
VRLRLGQSLTQKSHCDHGNQGTQRTKQAEWGKGSDGLESGARTHQV